MACPPVPQMAMEYEFAVIFAPENTDLEGRQQPRSFVEDCWLLCPGSS